jgi:hypothetical protein
MKKESRFLERGGMAWMPVGFSLGGPELGPLHGNGGNGLLDFHTGRELARVLIGPGARNRVICLENQPGSASGCDPRRTCLPPSRMLRSLFSRIEKEY